MPAIVDAIGSIVLGGVRLTTDPQKYRPPRRPKRAAVLPGIQGTVTIQDFGRFAKDATFVLQGSGGQGLATDVIDAIDALADAVGLVTSFSDWLGTEGQVWIEAFDYELNAPWQLYDYTLTLRVVALTTLRGNGYLGA
jgi:hypothetical protein